MKDELTAYEIIKMREALDKADISGDRSSPFISASNYSSFILNSLSEDFILNAGLIYSNKKYKKDAYTPDEVIVYDALLSAYDSRHKIYHIADKLKLEMLRDLGLIHGWNLRPKDYVLANQLITAAKKDIEHYKAWKLGAPNE